MEATRIAALDLRRVLSGSEHATSIAGQELLARDVAEAELVEMLQRGRLSATAVASFVHG